MKKMLIVPAILLLTSCSYSGPSLKEAPMNNAVGTPMDITRVVGIGKIEPENGIVNLASDAGGIVQSVEKQAGDSLKKGTVIITLCQTDALLKVQQVRDQIAAQQQQAEADQIATGQYNAQLQHTINTLKISERLMQTGAETKQNVQSLITDKKVLEVQLSQREKAVSVSLSQLKELKAQLQSAQNTLQEKEIKSPSDGVLLSNDAKVGGAIQPLGTFATLAVGGPLIVQGEVDEMFADRLAIGQRVSIHYMGDAQMITTGKILYLSPELSNKSLFTDSPGEQQDRRVRRIKISLDNSQNLLINTKVAFDIYLKNGQL